MKDDDQLINAYKAHHRQVWPSVIEALRHYGVTNVKIYLLGLRLFMYVEAVDTFILDRDFPKAAAFDADCEKWDLLMRQMQVPVPEAQPDEWWSPMELIFDMDWPQHQPTEE